MWRLDNKGIPLGESALGRLGEAEGKTLFRCPSISQMLWLKAPRRSLGSARRNDIVNSFLSSDLADSSLNLAPSAAADMSCPWEPGPSAGTVGANLEIAVHTACLATGS